MTNRVAMMEGERERKRALFLSRVHPKKGLLMLAQAWGELRPERWEMMIVGPDVGGHRAQVESMVDQLGIRNDWTFHDSLYGEQKEQAFLGSDLFVLPTFSENFGIAVAEALAYGLPVVTTRGAPWSGLQDRRCGWWVEPTLDGVRRGLEAGIQDLVNLSALLVSDAPGAGHPSEGALLRLNRSICKAIQRGRLQPLPSASI